MSDGSAAFLEVEGLRKTYRVRDSLGRQKAFEAVDGLSFDLEAGMSLGLVGESGCGKSTFGRCLTRLEDVDGGSIRFEGTDIAHMSQRAFRSVRREIQMVFQDPKASFNSHYRILDAIMDPLELRTDLTSHAQRRYEALHLLERVGLPPDFARRRPGQLSGGELQRVGIARAIAPRPRLVFLDEPTSALDMSIQGQIVNLLLDIQQEEGLSYILVSHDLRIVRYVADVVAVMYAGMIVELGDKEAIFSHPLHPYTQGLLRTVLPDSGVGGREYLPLSGELTSERPSRGCRLRPRCPYAIDGCEKEQQLETSSGGHQVRCWRAQEITRTAADEKEVDHVASDR